jgi:hypothetical protein
MTRLTVWRRHLRTVRCGARTGSYRANAKAPRAAFGETMLHGRDR